MGMLKLAESQHYLESKHIRTGQLNWRGCNFAAHSAVQHTVRNGNHVDALSHSTYWDTTCTMQRFAATSRQ